MRTFLARCKAYVTSASNLPSLLHCLFASTAPPFDAFQIRGLNKTLLAELEKRAAQWPTVTTLGDAFLPYIPMMKIFSIYVNDYDDFLAMTTRYVSVS